MFWLCVGGIGYEFGGGAWEKGDPSLLFCGWVVVIFSTRDFAVVGLVSGYEGSPVGLGTQISADDTQMLASLAARRIAAGVHR